MAYKRCDDRLLAEGIKKAGATSVSAFLERDASGSITLHVANAGDGRAVRK